MDDAAHIIVAAELTNNASDAGELPTMLQAVQVNLGERPKQALADTGYRSEQVFHALSDCGTEWVVALGREGKKQLQFDPSKYPCTAKMPPSCKAIRGRRPTGDESGLPSRPTAG